MLVALVASGGWLLTRGAGDSANRARVDALSGCRQQVRSTHTLICVPEGWQAYARPSDPNGPPLLSSARVVDDGDAFWLEGRAARLMGTHQLPLPEAAAEQLASSPPGSRAAILASAIDPGAGKQIELPDGTVPGALVFFSPRHSGILGLPAWHVVRGRERFSVVATHRDPSAPLDLVDANRAATRVLASWAWRDG